MKGLSAARATVAIAVLTAAAWLVAVAIDPSGLQASYALGFIPARFSGVVDPNWVAVPAFLTPLTATFVHDGALHLAFNMIMLLWCGVAVERVLGPASLILIYIVGAYTAAIGQWLFDPMSAIPMIGASGAVSAVVGAFALSFGRAKQVTRSPRVNRAINSLWLLVAWVLLQLAMGWLAGEQGMMIATPAHIGGFLAGLLLQRPLLLYRYRSA